MAKDKEQKTTMSGIPLKESYGIRDLPNEDLERRLTWPGQFPFIRGVRERGYNERLWTMRMFAGLGGAEETNERFKHLLASGQTGLSTAFDFPTLMGYDSDSPYALGEIGKCGVAIDTLRDMEILFSGIPLYKVTTSMTINPPAAMLLAMYIVAAEKQGVKQDQIGGTVQNDMLKEFIAQNTLMLPLQPSVKLVTDIVEYCTKYVPRWNTISISGYHIREAGANAVQELAFTIADGITYVQEAIKRGLQVDDFAPRLSFFFDCHNDFFEEIAKFRAARKIWAELMMSFGANDERSMMMRFHTQTAGVSLTGQQPYNNVVRTAYQALAAVLGGTQSLHTNSLDEVYAIPTEDAATLALRTQQILAFETGIPHVADPLAGSYFIENLTERTEEEVQAYLHKISDMGGMIKAIERKYPQGEIEKSAYKYQKEVEAGQRIIVGVNDYQTEDSQQPAIWKMDPSIAERQLNRLKGVKAERSQREVANSLRSLEQAARQNINLMPQIITAVRAYATLQEMCDVLRNVHGELKSY